ncbi:hypothetical protein NKR23_g2692 [Pleurostoma richardsiae]|uniref:Uncharacterized protein n=1 Tax=Pleurostoma richardsiae TaxID=41990 RepID=A0AA38RLA2_9PEZI|nr:hypothetical protein NKR23_g2692 [Pleurostoma richardsiae]
MDQQSFGSQEPTGGSSRERTPDPSPSHNDSQQAGRAVKRPAFVFDIDDVNLIIDDLRKQVLDPEASAEAVRIRIESINAGLHRLAEVNKQLMNENEVLEDANRDLKKRNTSLTVELAAARHRISEYEGLDRDQSPPEATPAIPAETTKARRHISTGKESASEKERLSRRFDRSSSTEAEAGNVSSSEAKSWKRRESYIEPWGPGLPGPKAQIPQSLPANQSNEDVTTTTSRPPTTYSNLALQRDSPTVTPQGAALLKLQKENDALRGALREALADALRDALLGTVSDPMFRSSAGDIVGAEALKKRFAELLSRTTSGADGGEYVAPREAIPEAFPPSVSTADPGADA